MKKIVFFFLIFGNSFIHAQNSILPSPVSYKVKSGFFAVENSIKIVDKTHNNDVKKMHTELEAFLQSRKITPSLSSKKSFELKLNKKSDKNIGAEGYMLEVSPNEISILANTPQGIFYGIQSAKQLIFNAKDKKIETCSITDYPRFKWRGLMLDVSRYFFTEKEVKAYIDRMVEYKFNVLHWHLTDDEGWRIEIKSLPKLTEIGAWRVPRNGRFGEDRPFPKPGEKATEGGFYTQEQIKDIVNYAAERGVTVVPEIDMPGHSMAALAAYPELSTKKEPKFVNPGSKFAEWYGNGKFEMLIENTFNPADEKVYAFVDKVMTEVAALFPSKYIHMGGDECYHGYWEKDEAVQKFMKENGLKNTEELQSYFVKRVDKIIQSKGKKTIGWDEILQGGLAEDAAVMSWRGMEGGIEAAKMGHEVVMSPKNYAYLDYMQGDKSVENVIYSSLSLKKTYSFEPVAEGVKEKYILGGQGNLWTEVIPTLPFAFYMTYPRAFAIAETVWSPKQNKNWDDFTIRTEKQFNYFDANNTSISKAVYDPIVNVKKEGDGYRIELTNDLANTEIYYTTNNTYPVNFGTKYTNSFIAPDGDYSLRCQTVRDGKLIGRMLQISHEELIRRAKNN